MSDRDKKEHQIRNSTVDFLVFTKDAKEDGIEVRVQNDDTGLFRTGYIKAILTGLLQARKKKKTNKKLPSQ